MDPIIFNPIPDILSFNPRVFFSNPRVFVSNPHVFIFNPRVFSLNRRIFLSNPRVLRRFMFKRRTCRAGEALEKAVSWCRDQQLEFDAVNDNLPEIVELYGTNSRKITRDFYIDDKAVLPAMVNG